jgi:hypothetical protein
MFLNSWVIEGRYRLDGAGAPKQTKIALNTKLFVKIDAPKPSKTIQTGFIFVRCVYESLLQYLHHI